MKRAFLLITLFVLVSIESIGQCVDPPTVSLSSLTGSTCGTSSVTLTGNTFGGNASSVAIKANGTGIVTPASTSKQPFDFTYTPSNGDIGTKVLITVTTNIPKDPQCVAATITYTLTVNANPSTPLAGNIIQPTCIVSTGSVDLSGLPSIGSWTITRNPGGVLTTGSGNSTTISGLPSGTNNFLVTTSGGCASITSGSVTINIPPLRPTAPIIGTITIPSCALSTGSVVINGLPATDSWTLTSYPGNINSSGTGTTITLSNISAGQYNYTVINTAGCVSQMSANLIIPLQPATPSPPLIGTIIQPNSALLTGSVVLNGLPESGTWTLTMNPGALTTSGTGATKTISGLSAGNYSFTVTNSSGCTSLPSSGFAINSSAVAPELIITNPAPVCSPQTIDLTTPGITAGSTPNLTFTYWVNADATVLYSTPSFASDGTYYIKGTTSSGSFTVKPVTVKVYKIPLANAGPDQVLTNISEAILNAQLADNYETGVWSLISGSGKFIDNTDPKSTVTELSTGENDFSWTVSNGVCQSSIDDVIISVRDRVLQTLITPNMDGKNDYLILKGTDVSGKLELVIFDRRGVEVYKNNNYDNSWNGVDFNRRPLADDTYFYLVKTENGSLIKGYIVVRR